jgi:hypothetical protein
MYSAASCPAYDPDSAKIFCGEKDTAHTADLYGVRMSAIQSSQRVYRADLEFGRSVAR